MWVSVRGASVGAVSVWVGCGCVVNGVHVRVGVGAVRCRCGVGVHFLHFELRYFERCQSAILDQVPVLND